VETGFPQANTLHAYIGSAALFAGQIPEHVDAIATLGSYLVITFRTAAMSRREERCAVAQAMLAVMAGQEGAYVFHPYPVTPYHEDYLYHFDRVVAAQTQSRQYADGDREAITLDRRVRSRGQLAQQLVPAAWQIEDPAADMTVEAIALDDLLTAHTTNLNGWLGPPWLKEGWFHAYLLLAESMADQSMHEAVTAMFQRLTRQTFSAPEVRLNAARAFVALLMHGCERVVVGYTLRREYFTKEFSAGIENIAYDAHTGFNSAIFLRTVKLKDLPWNGWLRLGVRPEPSAAWNPIAGFSDTAGRLLWSAVGDPALFPAPYGAGWTLNRIEEYQSSMPALSKPGQEGGRP
jgi:hypothetical protein